jgi:hypothetical protein
MGLIISILTLIFNLLIVFIFGWIMSRKQPFITDTDAIERWAC